jgi:hypothetical protein
MMKRPPRYRAAFSIRRLAILRSARRVGAGGRPPQGYCENQVAEWPFSASADFRQAWYLCNDSASKGWPDRSIAVAVKEVADTLCAFPPYGQKLCSAVAVGVVLLKAPTGGIVLIIRLS